jgi:hypothetical protein
MMVAVIDPKVVGRISEDQAGAAGVKSGHHVEAVADDDLVIGHRGFSGDRGDRVPRPIIGRPEKSARVIR